MKYISYDGNGVIRYWGLGLPPEELDYIEYTHNGPLENCRVVDGVVVDKMMMSLTLPGLTAADGVTEAVISGLPAGTTAVFRLSGEWYYPVVDDGTLEISAYDPQTVSIFFRHGLYQHPDVEVTFV